MSISRIKLQESSAPSRELPPELLQHPLPSGKELKLPGCSQARLSALRPGRHSPNNSPILPVLLLGHFLLSLYNHGLDSKRKSHFITGSQSPRGKVLEMSAVCLKKPQRQLMPARIKAFRSPVLCALTNSPAAFLNGLKQKIKPPHIQMSHSRDGGQGIETGGKWTCAKLIRGWKTEADGGAGADPEHRQLRVVKQHSSVL